jgi:hypothetical protein
MAVMSSTSGRPIGGVVSARSQPNTSAGAGGWLTASGGKRD